MTVKATAGADSPSGSASIVVTNQRRRWTRPRRLRWSPTARRPISPSWGPTTPGNPTSPTNGQSPVTRQATLLRSPFPTTATTRMTPTRTAPPAMFSGLGNYTFEVFITDDNGIGLWTSSSVSLTVGQVLTTITLDPSSPSVHAGSTQTFTATGTDQFDNQMTTEPDYTWTATAGRIAADGTFTAPNTSMPVAITAESNGVSATENVAIASSSPTTKPRLGDNWIEPLFEQTLGGSSSPLLGQLKGSTSVVLSTYAGGFTLNPTADSMAVFTLPSPQDEHYHTDSLWIDETYDDGSWTYYEKGTSSYTFSGSGSWSPSGSGSYVYEFNASGDPEGSTYTCTITATATASGPYSTSATYDGETIYGTWSQTTSNSDTITNDNNYPDADTYTGSRSGSGSTVESFSVSGSYCDDAGEGTITGTQTPAAPIRSPMAMGSGIPATPSATGRSPQRARPIPNRTTPAAPTRPPARSRIPLTARSPPDRRANPAATPAITPTQRSIREPPAAVGCFPAAAAAASREAVTPTRPIPTRALFLLGLRRPDERHLPGRRRRQWLLFL